MEPSTAKVENQNFIKTSELFSVTFWRPKRILPSLVYRKKSLTVLNTVIFESKRSLRDRSPYLCTYHILFNFMKIYLQIAEISFILECRETKSNSQQTKNVYGQHFTCGIIFSLNSSVKSGVGGKSHVRYKKGDSVIISLYSSLLRSTLAASSASGGGNFL